MPRGATALDFAYAVHTEIGNSCIGVRINGLKLPFRTLLKNGDEIEIIRGDATLPSENWLHYVKTGKARAPLFAMRCASAKRPISSNWAAR